MKVDRWPSKHPLCTCPDLTFAVYDGRMPPPDRSHCAGGTTAHPILTADELERLIDTFRERHAHH
jgi:hypothetical protein